jgi:hypothetical protein
MYSGRMAILRQRSLEWPFLDVFFVAQALHLLLYDHGKSPLTLKTCISALFLRSGLLVLLLTIVQMYTTRV